MNRRECNKGCDPQVDNSAIECDGNYTYQDCIYLRKSPYLEINEGDGLGVLISSISRRFKSIVQTLNRKIDYKYLYENGLIYLDDVEAGASGIEIGSPYIRTTGAVHIRLQ